MEKILRSKSDKYLKDGHVGSLFLDSGAHSLYTLQVIKKKHKEGYDFYSTKTFWDYVDAYAAFVKKYAPAIDYYATVDAIFNPEKSWEVLKYLEKEHGLSPVPVIHWGTDLKWVKKHLDAGYTYIGLGGLGQEVTKQVYYAWADKVFEYLCPKPSQLPIVRTHGFAMTAYELLIRYPWFSVDSASWVKAGGFGQIYVPHKRKGKYTFDVPPYNLSVSSRSPTNEKAGRNVSNLTREEQKTVKEWLDEIGIPLGKVDGNGEMVEWGVVCNHHARRIANLLFFEKLVEWLPEWPWPFRRASKKGLFSV